jgi:hypothetical protein
MRYLEGTVISRTNVKDGLLLVFSHHLFLFSGLLIVGQYQSQSDLNNIDANENSTFLHYHM